MNKSKVKLLNGIAGSAKSSRVDWFFSSKEINYERFTSTNKLKNDAENRYGVRCNTIAGGLFQTEDYEFYSCEREAPCDNIVIDEVLQSNVKAFDWIRNHVGTINMVVCTDDRQLLAPENSKLMMERFNEFRKEDFVIEGNCNETLRPVNDITRDCFYGAYRAAFERQNLFRLYCYGKWILAPKIISYEEMKFRYEDVYICHTNEIEEAIYNDNQLMNDYNGELIPKGRIAKRVGAASNKYPILPQSLVENGRDAYYQFANIGTPSRYQGSEVHPGKRLYFVVNNDSAVTNVEFYTVITRCKDIESLVVVVKKRSQEVMKINSFMGKPVVCAEWAAIAEDADISDELRKAIESQEEKKIFVPEQLYNEAMRIASEGGKDVRDGVVFFGNKSIMKSRKEEEPVGKDLIFRLIKNSPELQYDYMDEFYNYVQASRRACNRKCMDVIHPPYPHIAEVKRVIKSGENCYYEYKRKEDYQYGIDLKSAFPHILAFYPIANRYGIAAGTISKMTIRWWDVYGSSVFPDGTIINDLAKSLLPLDGAEYDYICSTTFQVGCNYGRELHAMCHKDVESNEMLKRMKYGVLAKPFLRQYYSEEGELLRYIKDDKHRSELLISSILCALTDIMLTIRECVYHGAEKGMTIVDCLYFDTDEDIEEIAARIETAVPSVDFRIFQNDDGKEILYQSYAHLMTKREIKNQKERARRLAKMAKI